jgi:hypothetical protein
VAENNCFLRASYQIQFILADDEPNELLTSYAATARVMESHRQNHHATKTLLFNALVTHFFNKNKITTEIINNNTQSQLRALI